MSEQYASSSGEHKAVVTPHALVIPLLDEHRRQAKECLGRSGSITIKFNEISATSLTDVVELAEPAVIID